MDKSIRILHLEDKRSDADIVKRELKKSNIQFELLWVTNKIDYRKALQEFIPHIILSDHSLPSFGSLQALKIIKEENIDVPFILVTSTMSDEAAVSLMNEGVADYILKDRLQRLPKAIINVLEKYKAEKEKQKYFEKIVRNEKLFRALIEYNQESITLFDEHFNPIYFGNAEEHFTGFTIEEREKMSRTEMAHPEDAVLVKKVMQEALANPGKPIRVAYRVRHKKGHFIHVEGTVINLIGDENVKGIVTNFRDVTERKNAEEKVLASEKQFRHTLNNMLEGIQIHDFNWCYTYANDTLVKYSKCSREDLLGYTLMEKYPGIETTELFKVMEQCMNERVAKRLETELFYPDGTSADFELSIQPVPEGLFVLSIDVTSRKKSEEATRESEERYRNIVETAQEGIWTIDENNITDFVNKKMAEILKYSQEEMIGKNVFDFMDDEEKKLSAMDIEDQKTERYKTRERRFITKTGNPVWANISTNPIFNKNGKYTGALAMVADITEKKEAEKHLSELSQRLLLATNSAKIGIFDWDIVSKKLIWDANMYVLHNADPSTAEDPFTISQRTVYPADKKKLEEELSAAFSGEKEFNTVYRIVNTGKPVVYTESNAIILRNTKGEPIRMIGVNRDITKQKSDENQIIQSENQIRIFAKHLNQLQEDERAHIAREIHDELGQELVGIKIGLSSIVKNSSNFNKNDEVKAIINSVDGAIQSLRRIATELRPGILDTLGLIPSIEWLGKEFQRKTAINCTFLSKVKDQKIEKDISICFFRICQEALTNISKHAGASEVKIILSQKVDELTMQIIDDGKGISGKKLENPFSTGLIGMRERAHNIEGDLQITSQKNKGTTVQLKAKIN